MSIARSVTRSVARPVASSPIRGGGAGVPANPAYQILIKTDNAGSSGSNQFTLPATGTYTVDWGDGDVEELTGAQTHTYDSAGEYVVKVTGGLTAITFTAGTDQQKLLEIQNWGDIAWESMANAYLSCTNLVATYTDRPNWSGVTNMTQAFRNAQLFNGPLDGVDVSNVTTFASMFFDAAAFNQPLSNWDVSGASQFGSMFRNATAFNQDIGMWDVSAMSAALSFMLSKSTANYSHLDSIYNGWSQRTFANTGISISFGTINYSSAGATGRGVLTGAPNNWTIVDGGEA